MVPSPHGCSGGSERVGGEQQRGARGQVGAYSPWPSAGGALGGFVVPLVLLREPCKALVPWVSHF